MTLKSFEITFDEFNKTPAKYPVWTQQKVGTNTEKHYPETRYLITESAWNQILRTASSSSLELPNSLNSSRGPGSSHGLSAIIVSSGVHPSRPGRLHLSETRSCPSESSTIEHRGTQMLCRDTEERSSRHGNLALSSDGELSGNTAQNFVRSEQGCELTPTSIPKLEMHQRNRLETTTRTERSRLEATCPICALELSGNPIQCRCKAITHRDCFLKWIVEPGVLKRCAFCRRSCSDENLEVLISKLKDPSKRKKFRLLLKRKNESYF